MTCLHFLLWQPAVRLLSPPCVLLILILSCKATLGSMKLAEFKLLLLLLSLFLFFLALVAVLEFNGWKEFRSMDWGGHWLQCKKREITFLCNIMFSNKKSSLLPEATCTLHTWDHFLFIMHCSIWNKFTRAALSLQVATSTSMKIRAAVSCSRACPHVHTPGSEATLDILTKKNMVLTSLFLITLEWHQMCSM